MIPKRVVTAVAFWVAALLPVVYLPVLFVGVDTLARFSLLLALLGLNAIALVLGHEYPVTRSERTA